MPGSTWAILGVAALVLVVALGALIVAVTSDGEDVAATEDEPTTTVEQTTTTETTTTTTTEPDPEDADDAPDATLETLPTLPPAPRPSTNPTITGPPGSAPTDTTGAPGYGSYVAILWSDYATNASTDVVSSTRQQLLDSYGVSTDEVYGDAYGTLRDGTVALVYAGGFANVREATQWCWDQGERGTGCFGVGLNDDWGPRDRDGTGRMYVTEL